MFLGNMVFNFILFSALSYSSRNYTGTTGQQATHLMRFLLHFLFDFKFQHFKIHHPRCDNDNSLDNLFTKLEYILSDVQADIEASPIGSDNPLLGSLQNHFRSWLCGIWDVWETLEVVPGDIGVMVEGVDHNRPRFKRFANVAEEIAEVCTVHSDFSYSPDSTLWSRVTLPCGTIR
jgi:hypothetical protein